MIYWVTLSNFLAYTYLYSISMVFAFIEKRGKYINCKHLHYIFLLFVQGGLQQRQIHSCPKPQHNEVMNLPEKAGMIQLNI